MATVNRKPHLANDLREFDRRVRVLETGSRFSVPVYTADPAAPRDGDMWINSTSGQLKVRVNGVTKVATLT